MSYNLSPVFQGPQFDNAGNFLVGGKLYWYQAGTTTPATVFQNNTGSSAHTNPVVLDARGEAPAPIWLTAGLSYKAVLCDSSNNQLQVIDNIVGVGDAAYSSGAFPSVTVNGSGNPAMLYQSDNGNLAIATNQSSGTVYTTVFGNDGSTTLPGSATIVGSVLAAGAISGNGDITGYSTKSSYGLMQNANVLANSYSITSGYNALSAGPLTINSGVTITVPAGSTWKVV